MAFQSGLLYFHHDLEGSHDTDIQAHLCVEHTGILDVLGLQLDLLFINGRTGQLGQSLGNFLAGDLAVQAAGCAALGLDGHGLALDLCSHSLCGGHSFSLVEIRSGFLAACDIHRRSIDHLAANGIRAERKSIYNDIQTLCDYGYDIIRTEGAHAGYRIAYRTFELPEVKLLVDLVQSSKFITTKKSRQLIGKLEQLVSKNDAKKLQRQVVVADRNKTSNEKIYYSVDVIHSAIAENRQIRFHYFDWNVRKEMQLRKNGRFYQVSPWLLTWDDENYYLVAYDADAGKMKHYRVDKMLDLSAVDQARCGQTDYEQMDIASYSRKNFGMFAGEETTVQLLCDTSMTGVIIDRFGAGVAMRPYDDTHILARAQVAVSPQFFGWLAGLSTHIRVISPDSVVNEYQIFLQEILRSYTDMQ